MAEWIVNEPTVTNKRVVKLTVNLGEEVYEVLKDIAKKRGITVTEAIRQAISTEKLVQDTLDGGGKILTQDTHGKMYQIVFR